MQLNPPESSGKQAISKEEFLVKIGKLISLSILREKAPDWLNGAIQHLRKGDRTDPQGRNTMKRVCLCLYDNVSVCAWFMINVFTLCSLTYVDMQGWDDLHFSPINEPGFFGQGQSSSGISSRG
jgi:hypothetical protein